MRTIITVLTGYWLLAAAGPALAQRALTLTEALKLARDNNKDLKAARAKIEQAHAGIEQARAALLPTLVVQGKYTHNNVESKLDFTSQAELSRLQADAQTKTIQDVYNKLGSVNPALGAPSQAVIDAGNALGNDANANPSQLSGSIVIQPFAQLDFVANLNAPLVVPWAYDAYAAARKQRDAVRAQVEATEVALLGATATAFYGAAGTEELLSARNNAIQVAQKTLDNAKARLEAGVVNRVEVTRAELSVVRARQAVREAEDARANAYAALATLIQVHDPFQVQVPPAAAPVTTPVDEMARTAMELRPEATAYRRALDVAALQTRSGKLRWAPTLSGFGLFRAFNYSGFTGQNYAWALGLQLDWLLYDGGLRDAARHAAESQGRESALRLDALRDTIADDLASSRRAVDTKRRALEAAQHAVALSKETLELVRVQHDAGTATQLDLLQAQDALVASEVGVAQARFDVALAAITLQRTAGLFPPH